MIQENELRLLNYTEQGKILELKQTVCRVEYISDKKRTALIAYEDLNPIELTEERLLQCGFSKMYESNFSATLDFSADTRFSAKRKAGDVWVITYKGEYFTHIKYLHQLQNLYFALTGKELEINL